MTDKEKIETKEKIMEVAEMLFSKFGYDGASVREIAKEADANIASINYYFKNKHGLYWAVMDRAHLKLEEGIRQATTRVDSIEDLAVETFQFVLKERRAFRNALKMMLGDESIPQPDGGIEDLYCSRHLGPPGGQYFQQMLSTEVNDAKPEVVEFGVKSIFSMIIQWGMFMLSPKMPVMAQADPRFNEDHFKKMIRHHCRATISYLKTKPDIDKV